MGESAGVQTSIIRGAPGSDPVRTSPDLRALVDSQSYQNSLVCGSGGSWMGESVGWGMGESAGVPLLTRSALSQSAPKP